MSHEWKAGWHAAGWAVYRRKGSGWVAYRLPCEDAALTFPERRAAVVWAEILNERTAKPG